MKDLISHVRMLIDDESEPYDFPDKTVQSYITKRAGYVEDYTPTAWDKNGKIYSLNYGGIAITEITDLDGNKLEEDDYELDFLNGYITFEDDPPDGIIVSFAYCSLNNAAAELWKVRAAKATISGPYRLGDEQLPATKDSVEFCIKKYWELRQGTTHLMER